jgi:hypothetical protein
MITTELSKVCGWQFAERQVCGNSRFWAEGDFEIQVSFCCGGLVRVIVLAF